MRASWFGVAGILLTSAAVLIVGGAGFQPAQGAAPGKKLTICLLPKKKGVPYFTTCSKGAEEAAKELGNVELIYDGPSDGSPREGREHGRPLGLAEGRRHRRLPQ